MLIWDFKWVCQINHCTLRISYNALFPLLIKYNCCSDVPMIAPSDVQYFPSDWGIERITWWMEVAVAKMLTAYLPMFASCRRHIRSPVIDF